MSELTKPEQFPSTSSEPVRSLNRQTVLEEDEYTAALSHIIARDFFPSLVHLDATNNYLDALRSADPHLINASVRHLQELSTPTSYRPAQTPSQTPWAEEPSETPLRTPSGSGAGRPHKRPKYDKELSLDSFQARYTSEDNSSFTQILQDENNERKEKYGWAWEAQKRVEAQNERMLQTRARMLIEPASTSAGVRENFRIEAPQPVGLITSKDAVDSGALIESVDHSINAGEESKEVAFVEVGDDEAVDVMAPKKDKRPAGVDTWKFRVCCLL